jgi:hypothetical protein
MINKTGIESIAKTTVIKVNKERIIIPKNMKMLAMTPNAKKIVPKIKSII